MQTWNKFTIGCLLIILGTFIDRALYYWIYLPRIGKTFAFYVSPNEIIAFYKWPVSWIGLLLITLGLILIILDKKKGNNKRKRDGSI